VPEPVATDRAFSGRFLAVDVESWEGIGDYEVVRAHDAAAVLPITPAGDVLLVRQLRPPVRQVLTEIPAGLLDVDGEDALSCASRELFEETGYRHTHIEFLGGCYPSGATTDQYVHLFWARVEAEPSGPVEPGIERTTEPFDRMVAAARGGRVRDAMTSLALLMAAGRPPLP
jgi:8-oxo-dGTP pyrophosphatase MutT (NUDIX family)